MRTILPAVLAAACGEVHFIDPNPPRLFRNTAVYTSSSVNEPVVWVAITNLFLQDSSQCASARETTVAAIRQAMARAGGQQLELDAQDLSPDCRQRGETALDIHALRSGIAAAQTTLSPGHVRPVIVYADDIDLAVSGTVPTDLGTIRSSVNPPALLWTLSYDSVGAQLGADRRIAWSYAGDPKLADRIFETVSADLPLQSSGSATSGPVPLLQGGQLDVTREFKVCAVSPQADSYPTLHVTHVLDESNPPIITFVIPQLGVGRGLHRELRPLLHPGARSGSLPLGRDGQLRTVGPMRVLIAAALVAEGALAQVRVEPRLFVKAQHIFVSGGLTWLERGDYYNSPGAALSAAYYLREGDAVELRAAVFASWLGASGDQVVRRTGLVPDAHQPVSLIAAGWRHSLTYGKVALEHSVLHFDLQAGVDLGTLLTDRALTPAACGLVGVMARLGERLYGQLDLGILTSIEQRSSSVVTAGFLPLLTLGGRL